MFKKTTNFVDANMINVNVILKMKFLIEINFLINWKKNTWKLRNERASFEMKKETQISKNVRKSNIILMKWFELKNSFNEINQQIFVITIENINYIFFVNFVKKINFTNEINEIFIFFAILNSSSFLKKITLMFCQKKIFIITKLKRSRIVIDRGIPDKRAPFIYVCRGQEST